MEQYIEVIIPAELRSGFQPTEGITIEDLGSYQEFSTDARPYVALSIRIAEGITASILAAMICDAVKNKSDHPAQEPSKISIQREWIECDGGSITRRISEIIAIER